MGSPSPTDAATTQPLYLRLLEHDIKGGKEIFRARGPGHRCKIVSSTWDKEATPVKCQPYPNKTCTMTAPLPQGPTARWEMTDN